MSERLSYRNSSEYLQEGFNLDWAIRQATVNGYYFANNGINETARLMLTEEASQLNLELGDHITKPINAGTKREVRQLHERFYSPLWDTRVPVAKAVTESVAENVAKMTDIDPQLAHWLPNEVGYQRYRSTDDWISPHRDRRNDQILAFTITIEGSAKVLIYEPIDDPDDYSNLKIIDEFQTQPGSIMFLKAPGLGNGEQVIHEVRPPEEGSRLILNLRMRPDILPSPSETI